MVVARRGARGISGTYRMTQGAWQSLKIYAFY